MNKLRIDKIFRLASIEHLIQFVTILLVLSSNVVVADSQSEAGAKDKSASVYQGTLSGEWSGEVMGVYVNGTFSINISDDGTVSGTFSGLQSGTITGTVSDSGEINAKGSAGFSDWSGKLSVVDGRLYGSGSWKGYGGDGLWSSN